MSLVQLTANEAAVLLTFSTYEDAESTKSDLGVSWTGVDEIAKDTGKSLASVKGILGSLIKKGLVQSDEADAFSGKPIAQCLTDGGVDALFALRAEEAPVVGETQVAATLAFIEAQTEEEEEEAEEEGPITFIPAAAQVDKDAQIRAVAARLAAEVFQEVEGETPEATPAVEAPKPTKAKATPRSKLMLVDLDGNPVESRRAPTPDTLALVLDLVTQFGGGHVTPVEKLAEAGFDEEVLKRVLKRVKSWFGRDTVSQTKEGLVVRLKVREAEAAPAEAEEAAA